jgi:HlyD family secretion protein
MMARIRRWANGGVEQAVSRFRDRRAGWLGRHAAVVQKTIVTAVILVALYWGVTSIVAYITAPRLEMTMSPVVGRIAVVAEPAARAPIARKVTYTGSVSSFQDVTVYPRHEGWVDDFRLYEGDHVTRGQVIARLDTAELGRAVEQGRALVTQAEGEVRQAEAQLAAATAGVLRAAEERAQAEAALKEAEAMLAVARANLEAARPGVVQARAEADYVEAEFKRDQVLVDRGAIGQATFDQRRAQFVTARERVAQAVARVVEMQAQVASMEARIVSARAGIRRAIANQEAADKDVARAEAALAAARARLVAAQQESARRQVVLGYTTIEAPITGRVAKRHIYAGILVKPGMPIVDLQDLSRVRVQAKVAEPDLPFVRVGTEAVVRFPALSAGQRERRARVTTVFPQLDPVSRTATVEILLDNPGELIKPDMYAVVDLVLERKEQAVVIPRQAVLDGPDGKPIVYVTDAVTAMSRAVKLGIAEGDRVEVLEGVKDGEMVVARGQRNLSEGAQVQVVGGL